MPRRSSSSNGASEGGGGGSGSGSGRSRGFVYAQNQAYHGHLAGGSDMNFRALFQDFNASKFVVFSCLLAFSFLFALKLDRVLHSWSWWSIFLPLWIWKSIAVLGAIVGSCVWWRRPQSRLHAEEYLQYKAMLISLATHLLLLMFELLVADNLESRRHLWVLVFVPLIFISIISIAICIWSVRHDRSFELELFCAVNILQFVFLALKLDKRINWPWEITFVPLWIVLCISLVGVLYTIIFAGILLRLPEVNAEQRRTSTNTALGYSFLVIPMLVFLVLLTNKLDGSIKISYFSAFTPLYLTFFTLVITSFGTRGGNQYWFGLRKPPCQFLFSVCPCLQLFGNISYNLYNGQGNDPAAAAGAGEEADAGHGNSQQSSSSEISASVHPSGDSPMSASSTSSSFWGGATTPSGSGHAPLSALLGGKWRQGKKSGGELYPTVVPALAIEMPD